jgi:exopolysaccharide biosynthesis polyprenyl glycosylphosphotransferase
MAHPAAPPPDVARQHRRRLLLRIAMLGDLGIVAVAFVVSAVDVVSPHSQRSVTDFLGMRLSLGNVLVFHGLLAVWHAIFVWFGLYRARRLSPPWAEPVDIVMATAAGALATAGAAVAFDIRIVTWPFLLVFWPVTAVGMIASRSLVRRFQVALRLRGRNLRHIVIAGTNARALGLADLVTTRRDLGYRLVGMVDDAWAGSAAAAERYPVVSGFADFTEFLRRHVVDEVLISLPLRSMYNQAAEVVAVCEAQGVLVRFLPGIFDVHIGRATVEDFEEMAVTTISTGAMRGWTVGVKRALDIVLAVALLTAASPMLVVAALAVKLTSPGPVLFAQERLGLNKRRFRLYKFRTMVPDAEARLRDVLHLNEASGPVFKIARDPRITPIGRILRKTSVDELPQLFNVLKGDMSLVGPRPLPVRDYDGFSEDWHRRRFSVRPGITCLWQVSGRSFIPFDVWMKLDLEYIDQWSLWLDLRILVKTIPAVLKGAGAA